MNPAYRQSTTHPDAVEHESYAAQHPPEKAPFPSNASDKYTMVCGTYGKSRLMSQVSRVRSPKSNQEQKDQTTDRKAARIA